ncbi:MAG TPA: hypothetical protein VEK79_18505 [Thermoanaerobaculia bacterium]|nr:hypothetical protein [Thermoanaerobaculia bacterium]
MGAASTPAFNRPFPISDASHRAPSDDDCGAANDENHHQDENTESECPFLQICDALSNDHFVAATHRSREDARERVGREEDRDANPPICCASERERTSRETSAHS